MSRQGQWKHMLIDSLEGILINPLESYPQTIVFPSRARTSAKN